MERDRPIAEIARKTGISLDRADPLLAAATVNRILLNEALIELERSLRISADQLSAASLQQIEAAKTAAAVLITDAGMWSAQRLREAAAGASDAVIERLRDDATKAQHVGQIALRAAWAVAGIGGLALPAIAGFWLATIGHGCWGCRTIPNTVCASAFPDAPALLLRNTLWAPRGPLRTTAAALIFLWALYWQAEHASQLTNLVQNA